MSQTETGTELHYLTVQDMLWINLQITEKQSSFEYDRLEEATFYQYGYGASTDLPGQAALFLIGFAKMAPFESGNEACAFVGFLSFLRANGKDLPLKDGETFAWLHEVWAAPASAQARVEALGQRYPEVPHAYGLPDIHEIVGGVLNQFPETLQMLLK